MREISDIDGNELVKMARRAVIETLKDNSKIDDSEFNSKFNFNSGVFVTINKQNSLRGCIGFPLPVKRLCEGLIDAAIAAATQDYRFTPLTIDEIDQVVFEVTVLSEPTEIKVEDPRDYLSSIKVGRDGLIVEDDYTSGLLLPQVPVEYNWDVEEFLKHTCEKAGLGKDVWKDKGIRVSKFEGMIFKEKSPNGLVIRESTDDFL